MAEVSFPRLILLVDYFSIAPTMGALPKSPNTEGLSNLMSRPVWPKVEFAIGIDLGLRLTPPTGDRDRRRHHVPESEVTGAF